jgi:ubiquinone biosynthesis accessory factor UbiK
VCVNQGQTEEKFSPMEALSVNEIARRLLASLPAAVRGAQVDLENNFRVVLRSTLGKMDLVTRDEFDVQTKVLERTRARVMALEARLAQLEQASGSVGPT